MDKKTPLSWHAQEECSKNWSSCWSFAVFISVLAAGVSLVGGGLEKDPMFLFYGLVVMAAVWTGSYLAMGRRWHRNRKKILSDNLNDYRQSQNLERVLKSFTATRSSNFPILERAIRGDWKPFRVEHFLSNSLRGTFVGDVRLRMDFLFGSLTDSINGIADGVVIPNLLDTSSVLFLKGNRGTLRVLIPSPRATKELFVKTLEQWVKFAPKKTHLQHTLKDFAVKDEYLLTPISHPQIIDALDASIEMTSERRLSVVVRGEPIQDGVVLATALEVNGTQSVFLPSGFFRELTMSVMPFIEAQAPKVLATVQ
ncbi:MAG: hypothetical protein WA072_02640 [Candidatus Moraniibacteriota bacterium]